MPFITPEANALLQAKKECLVTYQTDKSINNTYNKGQAIRFTTAAPFTANFSYKGLDYSITGNTIAEFITKCYQKLQLFLDYIIADMTNNIVRFTKKNMNNVDIVFIEDNITVTPVTQVITEKDKNYSIKMAIFNIDKKLAILNKAVNNEGNATFSISNIIKQELYDSTFFFSYLDRRTNFMQKLSLIATTMHEANDMTKIDFYAINANLNNDDTAKVLAGKFLTKCLNKEYTLSSKNKVYCVLTTNTYFKIELFLNDSTKVDTTIFLQGIATNNIYELNASWQIIKTLFPTVDEDKVIKISITNNSSSDTVTFSLTKQDKREFAFINRFGVWETILFKNNDQKELNINTERIQTNQNVVLDVSKNIENKRMINSGFIYSEDRRNELTDFFCSEKVYEIIGNSLIPIYIENDNVVIKLLDKTEMHNIEITYFYSENQKVL